MIKQNQKLNMYIAYFVYDIRTIRVTSTRNELTLRGRPEISKYKLYIAKKTHTLKRVLKEITTEIIRETAVAQSGKN